MMPEKLDQPRIWWDRLFAPSSSLAIITTVDRLGRMNAAAYGTCTRVHHEPVHIAFTANIGSDTARNVSDGGEFVVNLPRFDRQCLEAVRVVGVPFESRRKRNRKSRSCSDYVDEDRAAAYSRNAAVAPRSTTMATISATVSRRKK